MNNARFAARLPLLALAVLGAALALALLQRGLAAAAPAAAGVVVAPAAAAQSGPPGATVTYTVRVTNTGTTADVYTMTVTGNVWPANILVNGSGTGFLPLAPGAGQDVQIEVSIPVTATGQDVALFTTVSQADPGVSASATLTTSVLLRFYLPIILKN
jgi:uncharacterized membrane protein